MRMRLNAFGLDVAPSLLAYIDEVIE